MRESDIFIEALQKESPEQRAAYLDSACGPDAELRARVERLLLEHEREGSFILDSPLGGELAVEPAPPLESTATLDPPRTFAAPGTVIGRYKLLESIGEGGFGVVFMAEQTRPVHRKVALKIIKAGMDTRQVIARFEAERQALALMDHPNIAKVFDAGVTDAGRPYFVMEMVKGVPITKYCDEHHLLPRQRLELFVQVCHAVQHAHQKGIIHRDLKPSNVLVAQYDGTPVPKVIDFGVAKAMGQQLTEKTMFTGFGDVIGTPEYMSPEQAELNQLDIDTRSDIYLLGVLLYELLTGTTPIEHKRVREAALLEVLRVIREEEPPKPSTRLSTTEGLPSIAANRGLEPKQLSGLVRGELDWIVMKALEKDRNRRYETANGFASDVQRYLHDEAVQACPPSAWYRARKFIQRHRAELVAVGVVILLIMAGAVASGIGFIRAGRAERVARQQRDVATSERDRAVRAEADARKQEQKAEAEARRAELQLADSLINQGDALVSAAEFPAAYARYAEAAKQLQALGSPLARLDLSLVRLYRASPPPLWSITLPGGVTSAFAVLPPRKEIFVVCADSKTHAYDLLTGAELRSFGSPPGIRCLEVAASPDGPVLIATGVNSLRAIDPSSGVILCQAEDDRAAEFCVISPDGALAASGNNSGTVTFWETATLKKLGAGKHGAQVLHAAFSHDGATVATVSEDNTIALWDPKTAREIRRFPESPGRGGAGKAQIAFTADDHALLAGEGAGAVNLISLDGKSLAAWPAHKGNVNAFTSLIATLDRHRIISAGEDGRVRVFDNSASGAWDSSLTMATDEARMFKAVYVADTGAKSCAATSGLSAADQGVVIVLTGRGELFAYPLVAPNRFQERLDGGISMSCDGLLCAGDALGHLELRDTATGRTLRVLPQSSWSRATAFSPDSGVLYVGSDEGTLGALNLSRSEYRWTVHAHDAPINSIDVSPDGAVVASAGAEGATRVWETHTGGLLGALRHEGGYGTAAVFAPTAATEPSLPGRRVIIGEGERGVIYDWTLGSNARPKRVYAAGPIRCLTLSPNQKLLAVATVAHRASLLDSATLKRVGTLGPVGSILYQVQFIDPGSGPGSWALSCGNKELRAWDVSTGQARLVLDAGPVYGVSALTNAPNYAINTLAASGDGTVVMAKGTGRIDLTLPRRYRDLQRDASPVARAEWYAKWGLWAWTRELLRREQAAGHEVPALLVARANWMCGNYEAARRAFDLAVTRREAPAWYAALCLSVADTPPTIAPRPAVPRPSDPGERLITTAPLPEGVLAASDVPALKALIGKDAVVEGIVTDSAWSRTGKVMNIRFAGVEPGKIGLVCVVFLPYRESFDAVFGGDAAGAFAGARLQVRGKLVVYGGFDPTIKGWPQIVLEDPQQVTIVQDRPAHGELAVPMSAAGKRATDAELGFRRAMEHLNAGHHAEAAADFSQAIELQPDLAEAWAGRGECYLGKGDFAKAAEDFSSAIKLKPDRSDAWTGRAFAYFHRQQWQPAIADFTKAIELAPQVHTNWLHRGHAYLQLARWDKAAADFSKLVEQWPQDSGGWYFRGVAHAQLSRPDEALADLRQAVAKGFKDVERLKTDAMLNPLRGNDDFKKLLAALEEKRK